LISEEEVDIRVFVRCISLDGNEWSGNEGELIVKVWRPYRVIAEGCDMDFENALVRGELLAAS
jgi:hypothetical protein